MHPGKVGDVDQTGRLAEEGWELRGGSKLQTQIAVAYRQPDLNDSILDVLPDLRAPLASLQWLAPKQHDSEGRFHEPVGPELLDCLGLDLHTAYKGFWPLRRGAPTWDAVAWLHHPPHAPTAILVEAKSYPRELYASCQAKRFTAAGQPNPAYSLIVKSIGETQARLGLAVDPDRWMFDTTPRQKRTTALYQTANRLAMLRFLRDHGVDARLVYLLFLDDPRSPTTSDEWQQATQEARERLGLEEPPPKTAYVHLHAVNHPEDFLLGARASRTGYSTLGR